MLNHRIIGGGMRDEPKERLRRRLSNKGFIINSPIMIPDGCVKGFGY